MSGVLDRRAVVARLVAARDELLAVAGLGSTAWDLAAAGDHPRNFYLWGGMGGAAMVGLGLALARPRAPVLVITGDGELLMGLGALATIAVQRPPNLVLVALDNGLYGETGGQASHTAGGADLAAIARGAGIADSRDVVTMTDVELLARRAAMIGHVPCFARIAVDARAQPRALPPRDGPFLRDRMRASLAVPPL